MSLATNRPLGKGRRRGINYLKNLGRMIRDLTGFATLTFELLQNADDAKATVLRFDVGDEALVVFNNAQFSNCGDQDLAPEDCLMLPAKGHKCDFHSFRDVGGADKQDRDDTTGAFGIGFTAVYQIADTAELISNGLHWFIDEAANEDERIIECPGCPWDKGEGTTFILPWARDPDSAFRRGTGTPPVSSDAPKQLLDALLDKIPTAMLFLRDLRHVELCRNGQLVDRFVREDADELREITGTSSRREWLMLVGDFADKADSFFAANPTLSDRRRTAVSLAVPLDGEVHGLLCAYLPTDEPSRLPLHVNADFFPGSDRHRLLVEGPRGQWNRLAMDAIARTLTGHLEVLRGALSPARLWNILFAAHQAKDDEAGLGIQAYWAELEPVLPATPVMWTTAMQWTTPSRAYLRASSPEEGSAVVPLLERLNIPIVHPDLVGPVRQMTGYAGAHEFTLAALTGALAAADPGAQGRLAQLFPQAGERLTLWEEVERLLNRTKPGPDQDALRHVRIMPGRGSGLWAADDLHRADDATVDLARTIGLPLRFLDTSALPAGAARLRSLCSEFDLPFMLMMLSSHDGRQRLTEELGSGRLPAVRLLTWFAEREEDAFGRGQQSRIAALPIFPTTNGYKVLADAPLPGGFTDWLGIADAIDPTRIGNCGQFLSRLGAKKLTRHRYLIDFVPRVADQPDMVASQAWRHMVLDLVRDFYEISADEQVGAALRPLPLVPVLFHGESFMARAAEAYFPTPEVYEVFGDSVRVAELIPGHEPIAEALFKWLGVAGEPRLDDLVAHVGALAGQPPTALTRKRVTGIIRYLGTLVRDRRATLLPTIEPLTELAWLPAQKDQAQWYYPDEVQTTARSYLFETQGTFLDVPRDVQQSAADFLYALGVTANPTAAQVVDHLLTCAERRLPVNQEVFPELSRNADDPAVGRLVGKRCLLLDDGSYIAPEHVFRDENPFGRFRKQLASQWDTVGPLLERLNVKKRPDAEDAVRVLLDAADELATYHSSIEDPDDLAVIWHCWSMIDDALEVMSADQFAALRERPVIPNADEVLTAPARLVIDDMPGVAEALHLGASVLERKEGMWRAFEAAGVRSLSAAVRIEVVNREPAEHQGTVAARIHERKAALARVMDAQSPGSRGLHDLLSSLAIHQTSSLVVAYELPAFRMISDQVAIAAVYLPPNEGPTPELLVCTAGGRVPWMPVARELARALDRGQAPGLLAPILFVVLSASSLDEAHAHLDEAGLPRLDVEKISEPAAGHAAGLGGEASPDDMASAAGRSDSAQPTLDGDQHSQADEMVPSGAGGGPQQPEGNPDTRGGPPGPATGASDGHERQPGPADMPEASGHSATEGSHPDSGGRSSRRKQGRRSRLRSYVLPRSEDEDSQAEDSERSPVDEAGVHRVIALEEAQGRFPVLQPHNNPGFDVASFSASGELLRHIEVKSTDGPWDEMGVGLSPRQLEFAEDNPETFWLYVAEYATDDQRARVFGIPDAASKIEEYRFDSGWAAAAEDLSAPPSLPADVVYTAERPEGSWLPVRQMDHLDASTSPSAWIPWDGSSAGSGLFAVQVLGYALEPRIPRGSLVIVEPVREPDTHDLVLAELEGGWDHDGQAPATIRYWEPDIDLESGQLVGVTLAADESSGIENIDASASMLRVIGHVVDTLRPATRLC